MDSSAILALLNRRDRSHASAREILRLARERDTQFLMSNFLVAETFGLILVRLDARTARAWLGANTVPVEPVLLDDERRARDVVLQYSDKDFSYVDGTSFALMERLRLDTAFTFDHHFAQFGFQPLGLDDP